MLDLSLFSGAGGGLLASHLLGWRTIGYVENEDYCQRVLAARIADGILPEAPIFGDIQAFIDQGYAFRYRGVADVVSAGFPCTPFSVAGKQSAADDPRNMWPATLEVIRLVRPQFAFLENVPGLLAGSHGYFGTILSDLAEVGYDVRWCVLGAADVGAPHLRKRLWLFCYPNGDGESTEPKHDETSGLPVDHGQAVPVADAPGIQLRQESHARADFSGYSGEGALHGQPEILADAERERLQGPRAINGLREDSQETQARGGGWWGTEPDVDRVVDGVADGLYIP